MFSFKEFLEERKVDPEKLAVRAARRYGSNGKVPLKTPEFDKNEDEIEHAFSKKDPTPTKKRFKIKHLIPTNKEMHANDSSFLKRKIAEKKPSHISVITHKGKHYVSDGHHAITAARLRGETEVDAHHYDLDS